jgi:AcrR family transcriptional regulator
MTITDDIAVYGVRRPQRADAQRNFDALLASAREVFAAHGSGASLEDIARRAGVGIGTLYRNFPTRESLLETVYVDEVNQLVRVADESRDLEPFDALTAWLRQFVEYIGTKHALIDGLNRESTLFKDCRAVMYGAGEPVLERAQAAGEARSDVKIGDVIHLIVGIAGVAFPDDAARDRVLGVAIDGLRVR